MLTITTANKMQ